MEMKKVSYSSTAITGGFWKGKQRMLRDTTVYAVYDRFKDTGRFDAFSFNWKEGEPNKPHFFWDSDVAKWVEGAAYLTKLKKEPSLEKIIDELVELIVKNQGEDGYFNIYFTIIEPEHRFFNREWHELYCAGHLIEAAVAYYEATGKRKFLDAMCRYADYIEKRFKIQKDTPFTTPGHEEIELALVKLYECTGEERYLSLSKFFIDERGVREEMHSDGIYSSYDQSHAPVREQFTAEGHSVRALYLYTGMADVARITGDEALKVACERLFDNITEKRMYITGALGSSHGGEAFTVDYDLSNIFAYAETCASIALCYFAMRMLLIDNDSKYADAVERVLYNSFMSSTSLDGKSFFYENPLEILPYMHTRDRCIKSGSLRLPPMQRSEVFACSCCPPNIVRFIASVADMLYTRDDSTLYVHQYMQSKSDIEIGGKKLLVEQRTRYPESGKVTLKISGGDCRVAIRVPFWCDSFKGETEKGYAYYELKDGESLSVDFGMKVKLYEARPEAVFDCGRYAVMRGPVVYCTEAVDNGANIRDLRLDSRARFKVGRDEALGVPTLTVRAYRRSTDESTPLYTVRNNDTIETEALLIPYYAFANRGESEMQVWHLIK